MKNVLMISVVFTIWFTVGIFENFTVAQEVQVDVRTFVTKMYIHGIPYIEAKSYGSGAIPELLLMLNDSTFEEYWVNIVSTLGYIGDTSAVMPLLSFINKKESEISVHAFRALLTTFQAMGHLSQNGNQMAMSFLINWKEVDYWQTAKLNFSYKRYKNETLGEVFGRMAIQGLGISGRSEALEVLLKMQNDNNLQSDWFDNVEEAIILNYRVKEEGVNRVFGEEEEK